MRVEPLISRHLYQSKKVTLQNIGTFNLSPEVIISDDPEKDLVLPENAITFEFNKNAKPDEALIHYIMQETKKIKPLAASDLESYTMLSVQFLNIGKPLEIKGIGFLQKNQTGQYEFTQGDTIDNKLKDMSVHSEHTEESGSPDFSSQAKPSSKNKWILPFTFIILTFGAIIYLYIYYNKNKKEEDIIVNTTDSNELKKNENVSSNDSLINLSDSLKKIAAIDTSGFKVVIKTYNSKKDADKALKKLKRSGHNLSVSTQDSTRFKLVMSFKKPLTDSTRILDSLKRNFGSKIYIEN